MVFRGDRRGVRHDAPKGREMDGRASSQESVYWRVDTPVRRRTDRCQSGASLYEALITLSIASILVTGGTSLHSVILDNSIKSQAGLLFADLQMARSEAITRRNRVTLCKSPDGTGCSDDAEWRKGWIVFADLNENNTLDEDETVIHVRQGWQGQTALRYGGPIATYDHVTYFPQGYASQSATFSFCDKRGSAKARAIIISTTGRPRTSTKNKDNNPIDCSWASP